MANVSKILSTSIGNISEIYDADINTLNTVMGLDISSGIIPSLLLHFDGDASSSQHKASLHNNVELRASISKWDGSFYFNGSSSYIYFADSNDWDFGTGDFTIDFWIYRVAAQSQYASIIEGTDVAKAGWSFAFDNAGTKVRFVCDGPGTWTTMVETDDVPLNTWSHIALVRNGSEMKIYRDGVLKDTRTGVTYNINSNNNGLFMGLRHGNNTYLNAYIDEMRISKGVARWTAAFTPPTSKYSSDGNTVLLLHADGDASNSQHNVIMHQQPALNSSTYKFGSGSIQFDGASHITIPNSSDWAFGSGNFTIDFWCNFSVVKYSYFIGQFVFGTSSNNSWGLAYREDTSTLIFKYSDTGSNDNTLSSNSWTPTASTWYHIAVVRNGNTLTFYVDGQAHGSDNVSTSIYTSTKDLFMGRNDYDYIGGHYWLMNGFIDEMRVVKGRAVWTSNFTPPISAYS